MPRTLEGGREGYSLGPWMEGGGMPWTLEGRREGGVFPGPWKIQNQSPCCKPFGIWGWGVADCLGSWGMRVHMHSKSVFENALGFILVASGEEGREWDWGRIK